MTWYRPAPLEVTGEPATDEKYEVGSPALFKLVLERAELMDESPKPLAPAVEVLSPTFFPQAPSKPRSSALLYVTSTKTTLISTCGWGRSRFEMTCETAFIVSASATITTLCES